MICFCGQYRTIHLMMERVLDTDFGQKKNLKKKYCLWFTDDICENLRDSQQSNIVVVDKLLYSLREQINILPKLQVIVTVPSLRLHVNVSRRTTGRKSQRKINERVPEVLKKDFSILIRKGRFICVHNLLSFTEVVFDKTKTSLPILISFYSHPTRLLLLKQRN